MGRFTLPLTLPARKEERVVRREELDAFLEAVEWANLHGELTLTSELIRECNRLNVSIPYPFSGEAMFEVIFEALGDTMRNEPDAEDVQNCMDCPETRPSRFSYRGAPRCRDCARRRNAAVGRAG